MGNFLKKPSSVDERNRKGPLHNFGKENSVEEIDLSKIDFSFLENDANFEWQDTSLKDQNKIGIKAYSEFAF